MWGEGEELLHRWGYAVPHQFLRLRVEDGADSNDEGRGRAQHLKELCR